MYAESNWSWYELLRRELINKNDPIRVNLIACSLPHIRENWLMRMILLELIFLTANMIAKCIFYQLKHLFVATCVKSCYWPDDNLFLDFSKYILWM